MMNGTEQIAIVKCPAATVSETLTWHLRQNLIQLAKDIALFFIWNMLASPA
jgi:hypothetical protein